MDVVIIGYWILSLVYTVFCKGLGKCSAADVNKVKAFIHICGKLLVLEKKISSSSLLNTGGSERSK